ncbi:RidA family protein [Dactylosporangium sp. NPDC000521]|uniref:RidA family protein n=1 Tax=Dactylosporangium sp. NPDC000521 TaxID=3363975 RepID=UPI0036A54F7A
MSDRRAIVTKAAAAPTASFSQGIAFANMVVTAGQIGSDPETGELKDGLAEQVRAAIANLTAVLAAEGLGLADVVKTTCFLTNINDFAEFDAAYRELFPQPLPARSTFGVALAGGLLFEIEAWAVRP